ncbi:hypothetical protein D3C85_1906630 [compost metagenome]
MAGGVAPLVVGLADSLGGHPILVQEGVDQGRLADAGGADQDTGLAGLHLIDQGIQAEPFPR